MAFALTELIDPQKSCQSCVETTRISPFALYAHKTTRPVDAPSQRWALVQKLSGCHLWNTSKAMKNICKNI